MPLLYWTTIVGYIGAFMIGFTDCAAYQKWQEKPEEERAAIVAEAVASDEGNMGDTAEFIILEVTDSDG